jgi:hypothetical protein
MGLKPAVKEEMLHGDTETRKAWRSGMPPEELRDVRLVDELTHWLSMTIDGKAIAFRGVDFWRAFWSRHRRSFEIGFRRIVVMLDDRTRVPSQKAAAQAKRKAASSSKPELELFTEAATIHDDGVRMRPGELPRPFTREQAFHSRPTRRRFYDYLLEKLKTATIPPGCTFVMDFDARGPWLFESGGYTQLTGYAHDHGEADLMTLHWLRAMRHHNIYVDTIDSDVFLATLNYMHRCGEHNRSVLFRWPRKVENPRCAEVKDEKKQAKGRAATTVGFVDMEKARVAIGDRLWPFMLACVLCGTDFYEKKSLIFRVGDATILRWGLAAGNEFKDRTQWDFSALVKGLKNLPRWELASPIHLRHYYDTGRGATPASATTVDAALKMVQLVRDSVLRFHDNTVRRKRGEEAAEISPAAARSLAWNLCYWTVDFRLMTFTLPTLDQLRAGTYVVPEPEVDWTRE